MPADELESEGEEGEDDDLELMGDEFPSDMMDDEDEEGEEGEDDDGQCGWWKMLGSNHNASSEVEGGGERMRSSSHPLPAPS